MPADEDSGDLNLLGPPPMDLNGEDFASTVLFSDALFDFGARLLSFISGNFTVSFSLVCAYVRKYFCS